LLVPDPSSPWSERWYFIKGKVLLFNSSFIT
jgi:hypothetical protein